MTETVPPAPVVPAPGEVPPVVLAPPVVPAPPAPLPAPGRPLLPAPGRPLLPAPGRPLPLLPLLLLLGRGSAVPLQALARATEPISAKREASDLLMPP